MLVALVVKCLLVSLLCFLLKLLLLYVMGGRVGLFFGHNIR